MYRRNTSETQYNEEPRAYTSLENLLRLRFQAEKLKQLNKQLLQLAHGGHASKIRGRGLDFSEVRLYQPGDEIRHIDWRVTARRQKPHTKIFSEDKEKPTFIICDQRQTMFFGSQFLFKSVLAAEIAALFTWASHLNGDCIGGIIFTDEKYEIVKPKRNKNTLLRLISLLASTNNQLNNTSSKKSPLQLSSILKLSQELVKHGSNIVIISDFIDLKSQEKALLTQLSEHHDIIACFIHDPLEQLAPPPGNYYISLGNQELLLNTFQKSVRNDYEKQFRFRADHAKRLATELGILFLQASTANPAHELLKNSPHANPT